MGQNQVSQYMKQTGSVVAGPVLPNIPTFDWHWPRDLGTTPVDCQSLASEAQHDILGRHWTNHLTLDNS